MEQDYLYVIILGSDEDWEAGRGSTYYIEDRNGEKALPVFTTPEKAQQYIQTLSNPEAYSQLLESAEVERAKPLVGERFVIMPFDVNGVAEIAAAMEADYLVRDLHPGPQQEVLRFSE